MTKKKEPSELKKRGRKKTPIDYEKAEKLAIIMCTQSEIAAILGISLAVLEHDPEFQRIHKKGMEHGRASLRRMQYKSAESGNVTAQIWLGKQYLDQKDQSKQEITGKDGKPLIPEVTDDKLHEIAKDIVRLSQKQS